MKEVILKKGREYPVKLGHPWIFSGALQQAPKDLSEGELVLVRSAQGEKCGVGYFGKGGIAVRMLTLEPVFDSSFWGKKIERAASLRTTLGLSHSPLTNMYRVVNGEGDGIPGVIIDKFDDHYVCQIQTKGAVTFLPALIDAVRQKLSPKTFYIQQLGEQGTKLGEFIVGETTHAECVEHGYHFQVTWTEGQKTGFFLDQRENRKLLSTLTHGKEVLNICSFTGGFSVYAFGGGATHVTSVDISEGALSELQKNLTLNGMNSSHTSVKADCFEYLKYSEDLFDIVVVDPPAFAKHLKAAQRALRGYEELNALAAKRVKPGGLLMTYSCSGVINGKEFREAVSRGIGQAGRTGRIVAHLSQAPCHPTVCAHPEGEYLKGLLLELS